MLNRTLLLQTDADSGALTMLAAVVHSPRKSGIYSGTVYRGEDAVGEFSLRVLDEPGPLQVHVDLATQRLAGGSGRPSRGRDDDPCCDEAGGSEAHDAPTYTVGRDGNAVFHVSTGVGGYAVQLAGFGGQEGHDRAQTWDSRELQEGDLFAVTLLRPGAYRVTNDVTRVEAQIRLSYPQRGKTAYRPPEAQRIAVTDKGFEPDRVELQPLQGQVYEIRAASRLRISLTEPDDGPQKGDGPMPKRYTLVRRPAARAVSPEKEAALE